MKNHSTFRSALAALAAALVIGIFVCPLAAGEMCAAVFGRGIGLAVAALAAFGLLDQALGAVWPRANKGSL